MLDLQTSRWWKDDEDSKLMWPQRRPFRLVDLEDEASEDAVLKDLGEDSVLDMSEAQLISFIRRARETFQAEPPLLEIPLEGEGVCIFGDLHGNFSGLIRLLQFMELHPPEQKFVFLGDY